MSMIGKLKSFLRLQVYQSPCGIFISQSQYAVELLKKHGMNECVSMSTPMATERLDADLQGTPTDQTTYRQMIRGLMYLTASHLDIAFASFVCARYLARPTVKHLKDINGSFDVDHAESKAEYVSLSTLSASYGQSESSSRSRPSRPSVSFPSCIHCGYNDHHSNDCLYYPTCEICKSYDHNTHGHNKIISLRRGINPRNPQHVTKNYETCGSNVHTTADHNDIEWFRKRETLQAKNAESFKASKNESSSASRSLLFLNITYHF
ncbi:retrovirus-related pol polyprotein from transposon TNT 1-94 [Tanacetum coccineum]